MEPDTAIQVVDLTKIYWVVGAMIVTNIGAIGSMAMAGIRFTWWLAKLEAQVHENSKDIHAAHKNIRRLEAEA